MQTLLYNHRNANLTADIDIRPKTKDSYASHRRKNTVERYPFTLPRILSIHHVFLLFMNCALQSMQGCLHGKCYEYIKESIILLEDENG